MSPKRAAPKFNIDHIECLDVLHARLPGPSRHQCAEHPHLTIATFTPDLKKARDLQGYERRQQDSSDRIPIGVHPGIVAGLFLAGKMGDEWASNYY